MRLEIPDVPPSLNRLPRHWAAKRDMRSNWILYVRSALSGAYLKPMVKMCCKVTLCHARLFDKDNAYGACKPLIDALKSNRLIWDDTPDYLDLTVEQAKCPHKKRHTVVELEPA